MGVKSVNPSHLRGRPFNDFRLEVAHKVEHRFNKRATAEADQLAAGVSTTTKEFEGSRALRGAVEKNADELRKSLLQPAWDKFEKGAPVEISELQNVLSEKIDSLAPELADDLVSKYKTLIGQIENWEGQGVTSNF